MLAKMINIEILFLMVSWKKNHRIDNTITKMNGRINVENSNRTFRIEPEARRSNPLMESTKHKALGKPNYVNFHDT